MKMTMTNEEMGGYIETLSKLKERGKLGYAIARNLRLLRTNATEYLTEKARGFKEYGKQQGSIIRVAPDDYMREMGDIPSISHEVEVYQVDEETFTSGSLDSVQMESLLWMVQEG